MMLDLDALENMLPDEIEHLSQYEELGCAVQLLLHMRAVLRELGAARHVVEAARCNPNNDSVQDALDAYDAAVKGE